MKITKKICNTIGIHNDYDYADKGKHPVLSYTPNQYGRVSVFAHWEVWWSQHKLDETNWRGNFSKEFYVGRKDEKKVAFDAASKYMMEKFGYSQLSKTPLGAWMNSGFVEKRNKEIETLYKQKLLELLEE